MSYERVQTPRPIIELREEARGNGSSHPNPQSLKPRPQTLNPEPQTPNAEAQTNPRPQTLKPKRTAGAERGGVQPRLLIAAFENVGCAYGPPRTPKSESAGLAFRETRDPKPETSNPESPNPETSNPNPAKLETRHLELETRNP